MPSQIKEKLQRAADSAIASSDQASKMRAKAQRLARKQIDDSIKKSPFVEKPTLAAHQEFEINTDGQITEPKLLKNYIDSKMASQESEAGAPGVD